MKGKNISSGDGWAHYPGEAKPEYDPCHEKEKIGALRVSPPHRDPNAALRYRGRPNTSRPTWSTSIGILLKSGARRATISEEKGNFLPQYPELWWWRVKTFFP